MQVKEVPKEEGAGIWKEVENERSTQVHVITHKVAYSLGTLCIFTQGRDILQFARASKMVHGQRE